MRPHPSRAAPSPRAPRSLASWPSRARPAPSRAFPGLSSLARPILAGHNPYALLLRSLACMPRQERNATRVEGGTTMRAYRALALAAAVGVYLLILLGGLVRLSGAGLACPDWPLCHGRLVPPLEGAVLIEYGHRMMAAAVSLPVVATAVAAFRVRALVPRAGAMALWVLASAGLPIVLGALA